MAAKSGGFWGFAGNHPVAAFFIVLVGASAVGSVAWATASAIASKKQPQLTGGGGP
jgi:hypothetical protein